MRQANFNDKYYYIQDHLVVIGTAKLHEISKFIMTLIDMKTFANIPEILIIGEKRL
jgi:hypothetical protein